MATLTKSRIQTWGAYVLVSFFCVLTLTAIGSAERLRSLTIEAFGEFKSNPELMIYNAEYELLKFTNAIQGFQKGELSEMDVTIRYEVFASRTSILEETRQFRGPLNSDPDIMKARDNLKTMVAEIDALADAGWSEARIDLSLKRAQAALPQLRRAINAVIRHEAAINEELFQRVASMQNRMRYASAAAIASFVLLMMIFLYQIYRERQITRETRELHDIAESAVVQLQTELDLRKRAEQKSDELQMAAERSHDFIVFADADGKILFSNAETSLGGKFRNVRSIRFENALHNRLPIDETVVLPDPQLSKLSTFGYLVPGERRMWLDWTISEYTAKNGETRHIAIARDVSAERQAHEHIARVHKVESLAILVGGLAHDFNNILASLIGSAHLAKDTAQETANAELVEELDLVLSAAERASELVDNLLLLGRDDPDAPNQARWGEVAPHVAKMAQVGKPHNVTISFAPGNDDLWIDMPASKLHQILFNLVHNAMDAFGSAGGEIEVSVQQDGQMAKIAIMDNGPGIPADIRGQIFEPFFSTKGKGEGSGLGLALIKALTSDAQGSVSVDSTPGQGSTFFVTLPIHEPAIQDDDPMTYDIEATSALKAGLSGNGTHPRHVLVVDDEADVLRVTKRLIQRAGFRVSAFTDPFKANEFFVDNAATVDAIVSDVIMPGMSGPDLIDELRQHDPDIGVLYVSAYTNIQLGLDDRTKFLHKPAHTAKLFGTIQELCDARQNTAPS